jgi:prepilin-type N-terminal cleavage/methylation domain-containing protein
LKKAFTLVEVIISILIISVMGFALLQMHSNTLKSLDLLDKRLEVNKFSSFIFSKVSEDLHGKRKTVYEYIKDRYVIDDDDLIRHLKLRTYEYSQDEVYFLNFGENGDINSSILSSSKEDRPLPKGASDDIKREGVLVERVSIKDENNNSTSIFHFSRIGI